MKSIVVSKCHHFVGAVFKKVRFISKERWPNAVLENLVAKVVKELARPLKALEAPGIFILNCAIYNHPHLVFFRTVLP